MHDLYTMIFVHTYCYCCDNHTYKIEVALPSKIILYRKGFTSFLDAPNELLSILTISPNPISGFGCSK